MQFRERSDAERISHTVELAGEGEMAASVACGTGGDRDQAAAKTRGDCAPGPVGHA
jgi:hypothetical protein